MITGLVFDLPHDSWMDEVSRLRVRHDPARLHFPIEITVAGSSGLGWFLDEGADLLQKVGGVARGFAPFSFRFAKVERFPRSNVYYLAPGDNSAFHEFQRRLAGRGLRFEPTPFDYVPHCTIAILPIEASEAAHAEVVAFRVPSGDIRVSSVSFWSVDRVKQLAEQGARIALGG